MATQARSTSIGFLDLPPELRNKIYHLAMPAEKCITISYHRDDKGRHPLMWQHNTKTFHSLMHVSRQIYDETSSLLYNYLDFRFLEASDFKVWMEKLRGVKQHLRDLTFCFQAPAEIRSSLHELKAHAQSLRTITFVVYPRTSRAVPVLAKALLPFLRAVGKMDQSASNERSVMDLIRVRSSGSYINDERRETAEVAGHRYEAELKMELSKSLS